MTISNRMRIAAALLGAAVIGLGCQSEVAKSDLDAINAWSTAICACAAKSGAEAKQCAAKTPKPTLETMSGGRPKYKLESIKVYDQAANRGDMCAAKIP
jgi:hypothetical protein